MKKSGSLDKVLLVVEMILLVCAFYFYSSEGEINGLSIFLFVLSLIIAVARSILLLKKKIKPKTNSEKTEESDVDIPKTNNDKEKKATPITPLKIAIRLILFGVIGIILICVISALFYGRIYMYDGLWITGVLWTVCFISIGMGILMLVAVLCKDKYPKVTEIAWKAMFVIVLIILVIILLKSCELLGESGGSSNECGVCNGVGLVPKDGFGFTTCPYCKGSGIPPLHKILPIK